MAIKTTWTCDRCGHVQEEPNQMWDVAVFVHHVDETYNHAVSRSDLEGGALWCRSCCDKFHLIGEPQPEKDQPSPPEITLEDKIREIMREEIASVDR